MQALFNGFLVSGSLIVAIGAQNAFVLKQGLLKQHVFWVALTCFICDTLLLTLGVLGLGSLIGSNPVVSVTLAFVGAEFLLIYGLRAWRSAWAGNSGMNVETSGSRRSRTATVLLTLSITLLNPHVYLDTVVVVGGVAGTLPWVEKQWFLLGALTASTVWFFGLAYGARLLLPIFSKPRTWRILDGLIGGIMFVITFGLLKYGYGLLNGLGKA